MDRPDFFIFQCVGNAVCFEFAIMQAAYATVGSDPDIAFAVF